MERNLSEKKVAKRRRRKWNAQRFMAAGFCAILFENGIFFFALLCPYSSLLLSSALILLLLKSEQFLKMCIHDNYYEFIFICSFGNYQYSIIFNCSSFISEILIFLILKRWVNDNKVYLGVAIKITLFTFFWSEDFSN